MEKLKGIYSGWAGDYSLMMSQVTEAPRSFYFFSALACLGILISDKVTLRSEIRPQPRLYVVITGESADDKKSSAIEKTVEFFSGAVEDFHVCYGVGSAEGLIRAFGESKKLLLVFDEFRAFINKCKIESSVLLQATNSLFENNRFESAVKKSRIQMNGVHLAMLGASTVETYQTVFDPQFHAIGFYNRIFVVRDSGKRKWSIPPKVKRVDKVNMAKWLRGLLKEIDEVSKDGVYGMPLRTKAKMMFDEWYSNCPRTELAKRLDTYGHRLMILLAINDGKLTIDRDVMEKVIILLNYEHDVREQTDPIDADNKIAGLEETMMRALRKGPKKLTELKRATHYNRYGLWMFHQALKNLGTYGDVTYDSKTKLYRIKNENDFD